MLGPEHLTSRERCEGGAAFEFLRAELTAKLTATGVAEGGWSVCVRTTTLTIYLNLEPGGLPSVHLSRRERGFDSRWDHQTPQQLLQFAIISDRPIMTPCWRRQ